MERFRSAAAVAIVIAVASAYDIEVAQTQSNPHSYYEILVKRSDHWRSFSLRDPKQLDYPLKGGYAHSNSGPLYVTYSPATDTDPNKQDAAKVRIPAFQWNPAVLGAAIDASTNDVPINSSAFNRSGRQFKIGNEIMTAQMRPAYSCGAQECFPLDKATGLLRVQRGTYGTTATSHPSGSSILLAGNALINQLRLPMTTSDGDTYLFTWDSYHTSSYIGTDLTNHKAFQLAVDKSRIFLEVQTRFDGGGFDGRNVGADCFSRTTHVAGLEARSYSSLPAGPADWSQSSGTQVGPGVTGLEPIQPKPGEFCMSPNRWTRWWLRIEQRANDYDYVTMWVADEVQSPVKIYDRIPMSIKPGFGIDQFWLEFDTSTDILRPGRTTDFRDLVAYVKNLVVLRNPGDVTPLLLRPSPTEPLPPGRADLPPAAPANLRIIRGF